MIAGQTRMFPARADARRNHAIESLAGAVSK